MASKKSSGVHVSWPRPDFAATVKTNKKFKSNYDGAILYAHYELSASDLKKEVIKYLKHLDAKHPMLDRVKEIHENRFATVGKYMYLLNHGADLPDDVANGLFPAFEKIVKEEEAKVATAKASAEYTASLADPDVTADIPVKVVISIQDRLKEKAREVAGELEGWIDDYCADKKAPVKTVEDFINLFKLYDLKGPHSRYLRTIFESRAAEIIEAAGGLNKELNEAYSNFTKPELKKFSQFHVNLLNACDMLLEVAKVARKPAKKKPVSQDKLVSKLKYKKDDPLLGIVSTSPIQIIGAKEVWIYNTKTRKLAQYKANDIDGLGVKGTGLVNYTPDSVEKTVRKPAETLAEFKKASKVKLRTFMADLTTVDILCNGKMNEHCIILRVDK